MNASDEEFEALWDLEDELRRKKITGGISERVPLRKEVEEAIWKTALESEDTFDSTLKQFRDPNTQELIPHLDPLQKFPEGHPCAGLYKPRADIGHVPGEEWRKRLADHKSKGRSRGEIIEAENDAELYWIEDRSSNRSHKHEKK